jgi:Flp pilus assembly pilin Flp
MFANSLFAPAVDYLRVMLSARLAAARSEDRERGASVVEWVVITTIVVVLAVTIGVVITKALTTKSNDISTCINNAGTTTGCSSGSN